MVISVWFYMNFNYFVPKSIKFFEHCAIFLIWDCLIAIARNKNDWNVALGKNVHLINWVLPVIQHF